MSDIRFTAKLKGASDVARLLRRHPEKVGRTLESLVKQEARGLAVELARNTGPFCFSELAKKRGEKAVASPKVLDTHIARIKRRGGPRAAQCRRPSAQGARHLAAQDQRPGLPGDAAARRIGTRSECLISE